MRCFEAFWALFSLSFAASSWGCSSDSATPTGASPPACVDDPASTYVDLGPVTAERGTILRCAKDGAIDAEQLDRIARTVWYDGPTLAAGASIVRLAFATERGDNAGSRGFSSAIVLLPDHPRAAQLPVVVVAHGTVGESPKCPPSREAIDLDLTYLAELGYPLVGAGYAVILPDYAGYAGFGASGNPPAGYHAANDEAKSVLDAARALRSLRPAMFSPQTVLVGHSQGGHAVLSALALHESYGSGGELAGVVALAPSWFSMASFGAMMAKPTDFPLSTESNAVAASVWYHYSHAELLDGPGKGALLFAPEKRDAIKAFFDNACDIDIAPTLSKLGDNIGDLYDPAFSAAVGIPAGIGGGCTDEPCATWMDRYAADRPHITGAATHVPLLVVYGDADDWIPADRATCGFDRLEADGANATICIVPGALHDPVVGVRSDYMSRWIASKTLGASDPGQCGLGRETLIDPDGKPYTCASLPPND